MNKLIYTVTGLLCAPSLFADAIDSKVIHNYTEVGVGYKYVDLDDVDGHGVVGGGSIDLNNFLLGVSASYVWLDEGDAEAWRTGAFAGYVVRLMENHLNIIPRIGLSYNEVSVDASGPFDDGGVENFVGLEPGITISYAINNRVSVHGAYTFVGDIEVFDVGTTVHEFTIGTRVALADRLGLNLNGHFADEEGFAGISGILSWHF